MLRHLSLAALVWSIFSLAGDPAQAGDFVNFESAHVHPIALSDSEDQLVAVNTPEARVAFFKVKKTGTLAFVGDVPVGLEPVSLALRPGSQEVWVVNHLSDSVSIVDTAEMKLLATLEVGDEPTDVVFASGRAFVSLSGKEDRVVVYDVETRQRIASLEIFGDDPRALAVSSDGLRIALVVLESGNGTTTVHQSQFSSLRQPPLPDPPRDVRFPSDVLPRPAPVEPLIVQHQAESDLWVDETGQDWSDRIFLNVAGIDATLPDYDLFWIDAAADPPRVLTRIPRVGTTLFDVAIHPLTQVAWVPNTDARNLVRFEPNLRGHLVETRVSRVTVETGAVDHVDLNPHIDRTITPGPAKEIAQSLAIPGDGVFSQNGDVYYLTAFGSSKVAVLDGQSGAVLKRIAVEGGPSGLALHERAKRLYVMQRFSNTITIVDTGRGRAIGRIGVAGPRAFDPSPTEVRDGRRFLYDGQVSSGHGDIACATCHIFGNFDGLAWDLGDPQGSFVSFADTPWLTGLIASRHAGFDPMKGPMVTQTLRGLRDTEPFHWRGDRADFQAFNPAFVSLLGRDTPLSDADMDAFTAFMLTAEFPPNPHRLLNDELPLSIPGHGNPNLGSFIFRDRPVQGDNSRCTTCHALPLGTSHLLQPIEEQSIEVAHLRNVYEKLGLDRFELSVEPRGNLKGGFGTQHHGSFSLDLFLRLVAPRLRQNQRDMTAFLVSFSSGTFPCVGRQVSFDDSSSVEERTTLDILIAQADLERCDVIASGRIGDMAVGYFYEQTTGEMRSDSSQRASVTPIQLIDAIAQDERVTFMGVPMGSGQRLGIDRDRDGCSDGDELRQGTDPANPGLLAPDSDGDGIVDSVDLCPGWVQQDLFQSDRDGNGTPDECECGDVSGNGRVGWEDFLLLQLSQNSDGNRFDVDLGKCNVSGAAGNDPALCTEADLDTLREYLWKRRRQEISLEPRCLPPISAQTSPTMICADESRQPKKVSPPKRTKSRKKWAAGKWKTKSSLAR